MLFPHGFFKATLKNVSRTPVYIATNSFAFGLHSVRLDGRLLKPKIRTVLFDAPPCDEQRLKELRPSEAYDVEINELTKVMLGVPVKGGFEDYEAHWSIAGPGRYVITFEYSMNCDDPKGPVLSRPVTVDVTAGSQSR